MSEIDPRDFGRLESEVSALRASVGAQTDALVKMTIRLEAITDTLAEARGGWRTLLWIGGAAASIGGLVSWALAHLQLIR